MQTITLETKIAAPMERCFLLSLSVDLHKASTKQTHEEAIAGIISGILGPNERVTWRARHFGLMLTHATLISEYTSPVTLCLTVPDAYSGSEGKTHKNNTGVSPLRPQSARTPVEMTSI